MTVVVPDPMKFTFVGANVPPFTVIVEPAPIKFQVEAVATLNIGIAPAKAPLTIYLEILRFPGIVRVVVEAISHV